jgi:hypothetical protein
MAITTPSNVTASTTSGTTLTSGGSLTVASGESVIVGVVLNNTTQTVSSVTFNSGAQAATYRDRQDQSTTTRVEWWEIQSPSAGTGTVTVVVSGASTICFIAAAINGAAAGAGFRDAITKAAGNSATPSATITSEVNDLVYAFVGNRNTNSTWVPDGAPVAEVAVVTSATGTSAMRISLLTETGAASTSPSGVYGGARDWAVVGANVNIAASASNTPINALRPSMNGGFI